MLLKKKLLELERVCPFVDELISPIKPLGIVGFFYVRIYNNGEFFELTSNPQFAEHYFTKFFAQDYPKEDITDHLFIEQGVSLWELNSHNLIHQDGKSIFSYGNGITICENNSNFKELYSFYSRANQIEMSDFYLKHLDFLKKFKNYFLEKAAPLIKEVEQEKYFIPELYLNLEVSSDTEKIDEILDDLGIGSRRGSSLTPREYQCLKHLTQGKAAKEIAYLLGLSVRTIEHYISNIKLKWNCKKTSELIYIANNMNLYI